MAKKLVSDRKFDTCQGAKNDSKSSVKKIKKLSAAMNIASETKAQVEEIEKCEEVSEMKVDLNPSHNTQTKPADENEVLETPFVQDNILVEPLDDQIDSGDANGPHGSFNNHYEPFNCD